LNEQVLNNINVWRVGKIDLNPRAGGIWFAETKEDAENFAKSVRNNNEDAKQYIITLNNPKYFQSFWSDYIWEVESNYMYNRENLMNDLINLGYDGMYIDTDTWNDTGDEFSVTSKQYVVFDKSQVKLVNENVKNITFKKSVDGDRTTITAFIDNNEIGSLSMEILFDAYQYEFEGVFDEETFDEIYPDSEIVKIEHIEVDDNYKNFGIGSELMKRGMKLMKRNGYNQFYLNASPMGFKGLGTMDLVEFYKKFGFKELLNQGHNVLMGVVF